MRQQLELFTEKAPLIPKVRLTDYDWIVLNTSGGKDSQCMKDVVCKLAFDHGILDRVVAVHCDLAEEEWPQTREIAEEQARHYGIRFEVVKRKQGGILAHVLQRLTSLLQAGRNMVCPWPSMRERWCTSDHKRSQVSTLLTKLANETRKKCPKKRVRILNCMGMRANESCNRAKLLPFRLDKANTNGRRITHIWLPIFHWTLDEVWQHLDQCPTQRHYAYDLGMPRVSCCFCIYAPREALMLAGKHNPELLDRYCEVEEQTGFTFKYNLSLTSVREALQRGEEPGPVTSWEM